MTSFSYIQAGILITSAAKRGGGNTTTDFLRDLNLINFDEACHFDNPNEMWQNWVTKFMSVINKHAPLKKKRLGLKKSPWITPEVISKMRQRDSLKKKFDITKHEHIWSQYKKVRNETNNLIKQSKRSYFISNIDTVGNDPKKTWKLINELTSRKHKRLGNISKINLDNKKSSYRSDRNFRYFQSSFHQYWRKFSE